MTFTTFGVTETQGTTGSTDPSGQGFFMNLPAATVQIIVIASDTNTDSLYISVDGGTATGTIQLKAGEVYSVNIENNILAKILTKTEITNDDFLKTIRVTSPSADQKFRIYIYTWR